MAISIRKAVAAGITFLLLASSLTLVLAPEKKKLLPAKGKPLVMPNTAASTEHLDVFRRVTGYSPAGHKFLMDLDNPNYFEVHSNMATYDSSLMITLLFGRDVQGKELAPQWTKLVRVTSGGCDDAIETLGKALAKFGKPIYLDIGNEADFFYPGHAKEYVKAYRHVYQKKKPFCKENVLFFWHTSLGNGAMEWYPGDDFADGIALSLYNDLQFRNAEAVVQYANRRKKPVAIFEIGLAPHTASPASGGFVSDYSWKGYYLRIFNFAARHDVSLIGYAGFSDEVFTEPGPFHHNRIDYLSPEIQQGWKDMLKRPRYRP